MNIRESAATLISKSMELKVYIFDGIMLLLINPYFAQHSKFQGPRKLRKSARDVLRILDKTIFKVTILLRFVIENTHRRTETRFVNLCGIIVI